MDIRGMGSSIIKPFALEKQKNCPCLGPLLLTHTPRILGLFLHRLINSPAQFTVSCWL